MSKDYGITPGDLKKLAKAKGVKKISSLTAKEYRDIALGKKGKKAKQTTSLTAAEYRKMQLSGKELGVKSNKFSFKYDAKPIRDGYLVTLTGRHLSKNDLNGSSMKRKMAYSSAIKKAVREFLLINRKRLPFVPLEGKVQVMFIFYGETERDYDNNDDTKKIFQDTLTVRHTERYGVGISIIEDDNPDILFPLPGSPMAIKSPEWKAEAWVFAFGSDTSAIPSLKNPL